MIRLAILMLLASAPAAADAGRLGGGDSVEVSFGRIIAALIICIMVAALAALVIRQRGGKIELSAFLSRLE
nr:hypothetical protein [Pseudomonadota bacterium]